MNLPILVMRGSSLSLKIKRSVWPHSAASFALISSAFVTIERNLYIVNGLPWMPTRVCLNSTGPPSSSLMAMATPSMIGELMTSATAESTISITRLITYVLVRYCGKLAISTGCSAEFRRCNR